MAQKLTLRIKSKKSQNAVLRDVDVTETVQTLLDKLFGLTGVPQDQMAILKGYPPKRICYDSSNLIESLGLQTQDTIIVELDTTGNPNQGDEAVAGKSQSVKPEPQSTSTRTSELSEPGAHSLPKGDDNGPSYVDLIPSSDDDTGLLLRQIVPSDNSCLFTSVTFCLSAGELTGDGEYGSRFLREMIANTVAANPNQYTEAILGRPNKDYVSWIQKPESWGGGIELSILADFYGMQISVVDTQSLHISCFGEDKNFSQGIFIIYDGIHYDPLYFEPFTGGARRTVFETADTKILDLAIQLAREAKASNQFTDLKNFSLRCQNCNTLLRGQEEAQAHAKKTGHASFAEIQQNK